MHGGDLLTLLASGGEVLAFGPAIHHSPEFSCAQHVYTVGPGGIKWPSGTLFSRVPHGSLLRTYNRAYLACGLGLVFGLLLTLGGYRQTVAGNVRVHVHGHGVAVVDGAGEDTASQAVADLALHQAA